MQLAQSAIDMFVSEGAVGDYPCYSVTINGHANPLNVAEPGVGPDFLTVTITGVDSDTYEKYYKHLAAAA